MPEPTLTEPTLAEPLAERVRRWLAPPVALLASTLGLTCVVSLPDVVRAVDELAVTNDRYVGWAGLGLAACVAAAAASLLAAPRLGAGPPILIGAAASVFGLGLGRVVVVDVQVALALVLLGVAVGGLMSGGAGMALELTGPLHRVTLLCWALPLVAAWPVLAWSALHTDPDDVRLTLSPPVWVLAVASSVLVLWSALSMLLEPDRSQGRDRESWESAWAAVLSIAGMAALAVMMLGFGGALAAYWVRPLTIVLVGAAVVAVAVTVLLVPVVAARVAYVTVGVAALAVPTCVELAVVVTDGGSARVAAVGMCVLVAAALAGTWVGWRWPERWAVLGLLVLAGGAAATWPLPATQWPLVAGLAPLLCGGAAAVGAGVRLADFGSMPLRFVAMALVTGLVVGVVAALPLGWALGGALPDTTSDARAAGRVVLGLTFALGALASAYVSTLVRHLPRRHEVPVETSGNSGPG